MQIDGATVNVAQPEIHNHLPETVVNMEANIETPATQVVVAHPKRAIQTIERDAETLEASRTITTYEP